jgi:3-oxoadipate enol-lactonase
MPTVRMRGVETYYERHGDGYPIVLVHGSGWDHRQWSPQVETLASEYELITYDVRFHGDTELIGEEHKVGPNSLVHDLHAFINTLDLNQKPIVVGLSMGGAIAHVHAEEYPEQIAGVVTYEAPLSVESPESTKMQLLFRLYFGVNQLLGPGRTYSFNQWLLGHVTDRDGQQNDALVDGLGMTKREYVKDAMSRTNMRGQRRVVEEGLAHDDLSKVSVPTLAVIGENAAETHVEAAADLASGIPDAEERVLEGADHGGNITNVEEFNELLREFVKNRVE